MEHGAGSSWLLAVGSWASRQLEIGELVNSDHPPSLPWTPKPLERHSLGGGGWRQLWWKSG